jgi:outer membrane protein assembly factor BamB
MQKGLSQWDRSKASDGYVIMSIRALGKTVLVDINGDIVRMWDGTGQEVLPPEMANGEKGHVLVTEGMMNQGAVLQERDWDNNVVWEYDFKGELQQHHDWQKLSNGNYLILSYSDVPKEKIPKTFYGIGIEGEKSLSLSSMQGDRITEVTPGGEIVWDWKGYDHLDLQKICGYCGGVDWTHFNAIHYCTNPGYEGKILASNRHHNEIIMIDQKTGNIVWRWGEDVLGHQHDVQMIDPGLPGEGNILVFDNGHHSEAGSSNSAIYEVDPKTDKIVWTYKPGETFRSWHISGCQRLYNGNTLITEGENGRIFEVTVEGEIVWEYNNPFYEAMQGGPGRGAMQGGARGGMQGGASGRGGMQQGGMPGGMQGGGPPGGGGGLDGSVFKARKVPISWVPEFIKMSPELFEAASLRSKARSAFNEAEVLTEKANQVIKNIK